MGAAIQVFLHEVDIPTVDEWNATIRAEGFDLILDAFDLRADDGYRPAILKGEESGFEWYLTPVAKAEEAPGFPFKAHIDDCDLKAQLCFTSYADEDVASSIAGAVLAKMTGGYYWDPESDDRFLRADDAINAARQAVREWELRGPFGRKSEPAPFEPPVTSSQVPPVLSTPIPPPLPASAPLLASRPPVILRYRLWCVLFVVIYSGIVVAEVLNARGVIEPPLGLFTELLTANDPAARAQAITDAREDAFGGGVVGAIGALFYGFAATVPRKPWGWTVGLVAIIASFLPFIVTAAGMIPLLICWAKPETKRYFLRPK